MSATSKKITFVAYNAYGMGGSVRFTITTANYLASKGYTVKIVSCYQTSDIPTYWLDPRVTLTPLVNRKKKNVLKSLISRVKSRCDHPDSDTYGGYSLYTDLKLFLCFFFLKTDFLICTTAYFSQLALKPHLFKRKLVMQEHIGFNIHTEPFQNHLLKLLSQSDYVHCVNKKDAAIYQNLLPNKVKVFSIYNSTSIGKKVSSCSSKVIISTGRLVYQKNYSFLLKAFAEFHKFFPDWKLMILGNGDQHSELVATIAELGISNNTMLIPANNNVHDYLLNSSIYACSSRYESFCISLLEAMECGLACVSLDCDGPSEYLVDGVNALITPQNDINKLVEALCFLATSETDRIRFGMAARATACQFSTDEICKHWEMFFINEQ